MHYYANGVGRCENESGSWWIKVIKGKYEEEGGLFYHSPKEGYRVGLWKELRDSKWSREWRT